MTTPDRYTHPNYPVLTEREQQVGPGDYRVISGDDSPVDFDPGSLDGSVPEYTKDLIPGVRTIAQHWELDGEQNPVAFPVVSFLYNKVNPKTGGLETEERVLVLRGRGYGEHPGHQGQAPARYLVGSQIGTRNPETGEVEIPQTPRTIPVKHFSEACIVAGPYQETILA